MNKKVLFVILIVSTIVLQDVQGMDPSYRLRQKKKAVIELISRYYHAKTVRLWGVPETDNNAEPDVDVLVNLDKKEGKDLILVCLRNRFIKSIHGKPVLDPDGFKFCADMRKLLKCPVDLCQEKALKNFYPITYEETMPTRNWGG